VKKEFRRAWEDLKSQISYDEIAEARRIAARRKIAFQRTTSRHFSSSCKRKAAKMAASQSNRDHTCFS